MRNRPLIYIDGNLAESPLQTGAWRPVTVDQRIYVIPDGPDDTPYYVESYKTEGEDAELRVLSPGHEPA